MYSEIASNKRKTVFLMTFFVLFVIGLSWIFSYAYNSPSILYVALIFSLIYTFISYYNADKMAIAINGAVEIKKRDNPRLYRIVENIAITEGLPTPRVYIMEDPAPNAFATGRDPNHAVVCATTGILDMMTDSELEGVMAHEMGHIKNYDIRVSMIVVALVGVIAFLCDMFLRMSFWGGSRDDDRNNNNSIFILLAIVAAILAPIAATLTQLAVSRKREYLADATGALTTRHPEALASALAKIQKHGSALRKQNTSTAHLFFSNPMKGKSLISLFSTHPPLQDRIARLKTMGSKL